MISFKFDHKHKNERKKEYDIVLYTGISPLPVRLLQSAVEYRLRYEK